MLAVLKGRSNPYIPIQRAGPAPRYQDYTDAHALKYISVTERERSKYKKIVLDLPLHF